MFKGIMRRADFCSVLEDLALLPKPPDCPCDVATEAAVCFPARLAFGHSTLDVGSSFGKMACLGERYSIQDRVQAPVAAAVQAMADMARRRGL